MVYVCEQEDTPLAGSSAGALVCAVVAGGLDMRDALEATKELGRECRQGGTAFKLGVSSIRLSMHLSWFSISRHRVPTSFCLVLTAGQWTGGAEDLFEQILARGYPSSS